MSVIKFSFEEFSDIRTSLLAYSKTRISPLVTLDYQEKYLAKELNEDESIWLEMKINSFVQNLYIANQIAFGIQYNRDQTSFEVDKSVPDSGKRLEKWQLYDELRSIYYNLFTNGGRMFLSKQDEDLLTRIINDIANTEMRLHVEKTQQRIAQVNQKLKEAKLK